MAPRAIWNGVLILSLVGLTCVACGSTRPSPSQAQQDLDHMIFVRHRNGLCFGLVRFVTYGWNQGVSITMVPSEACR